MATKIDAGENVRRADYFFVDPGAVIVDEALRGRHTPPSDAEIVEMAESLMEFGQRTPIEGRKLPGNKVQVAFGFTRTAAARLIRAGFTASDGSHKQDDQFMLKVIVTDANDKDAFLHNIVENAHRNATTPIDDAYNQGRMRDQYGYSDDDIAKLYRYKGVGKVQRMRQLLALPHEVQMLVHTGEMTVTAAIDLLDLPAEKMAEVIGAAQTDSGVDSHAVREAVRNHTLDETDAGAGHRLISNEQAAAVAAGQEVEIVVPAATTKAKPKYKPRSMREVRAFLTMLTEREQPQESDVKLGAFAETMMLWLAGKRTDKTLLTAALAISQK